ncbi:hypothetical protein VTO42DRAFT_1707 [Malbranchea cinnamomea]
MTTACCSVALRSILNPNSFPALKDNPRPSWRNVQSENNASTLSLAEASEYPVSTTAEAIHPFVLAARIGGDRSSASLLGGSRDKLDDQDAGQSIVRKPTSAQILSAVSASTWWKTTS